jgi:cell division protein FtsZ
LEVYDAADVVREAVDPDANIIVGAVIDESLSEEIRITVIATGFENENNRIALNALAEEQKKIQMQAVVPKEPEVAVDVKEPETNSNNFEADDLDIPVFLRRQKRH